MKWKKYSPAESLAGAENEPDIQLRDYGTPR